MEQTFQSDITFDRKRLKNVEIKTRTEETKNQKNYITPRLAPAWLSTPPLPKREPKWEVKFPCLHSSVT